MVVPLATLQELKEHLSFNTDDLGQDDDNKLSLMLLASSAIILRYIGADVANYPGSGEEIDPSVKLAALVLAGYFYKNPDADPDKDFSYGHLPWYVTALIYHLRKPTLA